MSLILIINKCSFLVFERKKDLCSVLRVFVLFVWLIIIDIFSLEDFWVIVIVLILLWLSVWKSCFEMFG